MYFNFNSYKKIYKDLLRENGDINAYNRNMCRLYMRLLEQGITSTQARGILYKLKELGCPVSPMWISRNFSMYVPQYLLDYFKPSVGNEQK